MRSYNKDSRAILARTFVCLFVFGATGACGEKPAIDANRPHHHEDARHEDHPDRGKARDHDTAHGDHDEHNGHDDHNDEAHHDGHDDEAHHDDHDGHDDEHHDHGDHHHAPRSVGEGMAVIAADEELGVELAPAALERLGVRFGFLQDYRRPGGAERDYRVPADCVVFFENDAWIFLRDANRRVRPYSVRVAPRAGTSRDLTIIDSNFASSQLQSELVIVAAPLVRLAYLEAFGASGSGHGH